MASQLIADLDHWCDRIAHVQKRSAQDIRLSRSIVADVGDLRLCIIASEERLSYSSVRACVGLSELSHRVRFGRVALVTALALSPILLPFASVIAAAATILQVEASGGLPGFHRGELQRYLAMHMAEAGLGEWRFVPAAESSSAADRVEWTFRLNPYAGGEVRNFVHTQDYEPRLGARRPITIEARFYLNGEFQTLVEKQAVIQGGPNDPEFAAAVASATQNLLGPSGAYHAIDLGLRRGHL